MADAVAGNGIAADLLEEFEARLGRERVARTGDSAAILAEVRSLGARIDALRDGFNRFGGEVLDRLTQIEKSTHKKGK